MRIRRILGDRGRTGFNARTVELYLAALTCPHHLRNVDPTLALVVERHGDHGRATGTEGPGFQGTGSSVQADPCSGRRGCPVYLAALTCPHHLRNVDPTLAMEDVLEFSPYEDNEVLVCLDETSKQQVKETRLPRPPRPGSAVAYDYEYERNGVSNLFMQGWRRVGVTDRRTKVDWAHQVGGGRGLPDKDRIVLVMDNLNTHHPYYTRRSSLWKRGVSPRGDCPAESECWPECLDHH